MARYLGKETTRVDGVAKVTGKAKYTAEFQIPNVSYGFIVLSTVKTDGKITIEGKEYPLYKVDVSSASHPFYTGTQRILDIAGRVEKFGNKLGGKTDLSNLLKKKLK